MRRIALFALLLPAIPATASAQTPTSTPSAPAATKPAAAKPKAAAPVTGQLVVRLERVGRDRTVLAGDRFRVRGALKPYVAGQRVTVRFYRDGRKVAARRVTPQRASPAFGRFLVSYSSHRGGRLTVRVSHAATARMATVRSRTQALTVLRPFAAQGSRGAAVRWLQRHLAAQHYVVGAGGRFDGRTARAVVAFRKVMRMHRTASADETVFRALARGAGAFKARYPGDGRHAEGDVSRQVLALIGAGGKVERIYPMSSGKPSTPTVLGRFRVYSKTPGTNSHGMVFSSYFIRGYAVHGYYSVPAFNASHGCLRVPIPDAVSIYRWLSFGTPVDVYR